MGSYSKYNNLSRQPAGYWLFSSLQSCLVSGPKKLNISKFLEELIQSKSEPFFFYDRLNNWKGNQTRLQQQSTSVEWITRVTVNVWHKKKVEDNNGRNTAAVKINLNIFIRIKWQKKKRRISDLKISDILIFISD